MSSHFSRLLEVLYHSGRTVLAREGYVRQGAMAILENGPNPNRESETSPIQRMKKWQKLAIVGLCSLGLSGCGYSEDVAKIYVLTSAETATRFTADLGAIAKRHGLDPILGQSVPDNGRQSFVIEATGKWLRLWGTNMPMSGYESSELCGNYGEAHPDPGQYVVSLDHSLSASMIRSMLPESAKNRPREILSDISKELANAGYDVRAKAVTCSPLSKELAPKKPTTGSAP